MVVIISLGLSSHHGCLPEDMVVNEILPKLPVQSPLRFKSVSKKWSDLMPTTLGLPPPTSVITPTPPNSSSSSQQDIVLVAEVDTEHTERVRFYSSLNPTCRISRHDLTALGNTGS